MAVELFGNGGSTTLSAAVDNLVTTLPVTSAAGFPSGTGQYRIRVEDELMIVTGGLGTTSWTVTRGAEGTTAASHASGVTVRHVLTKASLPRVIDLNVVSRTAAYTASVRDLVLADSTGGGFAVTLPTGAPVGSTVTVKKTAGAPLVSVVGPSGAPTEATLDLEDIGESVTVAFTGSKWVVTGQVGAVFVPTSATLALDVIEHATLSDNFDGTTLDAKWSLVGYVAGDITVSGGAVSMVSKGQNHYLWQPAPAGDFSVVMSRTFTQPNGTMFGPLILNDAGTGVGATPYDNPNAHIITAVSSGGYGSSFKQTAETSDDTRSGTRTWIRLRKAAGVYYVSSSVDGNAWRPEVSLTPTAFTPTRIGFGVYAGTTIGGADLFDVRA